MPVLSTSTEYSVPVPCPAPVCSASSAPERGASITYVNVTYRLDSETAHLGRDALQIPPIFNFHVHVHVQCSFIIIIHY
jgi:hypothetical protein